MEAPNGTKLSARAAAGQTTSERLELKKPDTVIYRPDGKQLQM